MNENFEISEGTASAILFFMILLVVYIACAFVGASFSCFEWPMVLRALFLIGLVGDAVFCFGEFGDD